MPEEKDEDASTIESGLKKIIVSSIGVCLSGLAGWIAAAVSNMPALPILGGKKIPAEYVAAIACIAVALLALYLLSEFKLWRVRSDHPEEDVGWDKIAIRVGELNGDDDKHSHRENIFESIKEPFRSRGIELFHVCWADFHVPWKGNLSEEVTKINKKTKDYFDKHPTPPDKVLIWGEVLKGKSVTLQLHFASPAKPGNDPERFSYDVRQMLPTKFSGKLGATLVVPVIEKAALTEREEYVDNVLVPFAGYFKEIVKELIAEREKPLAEREWSAPDERGLIFLSYGRLESAVGEQTGKLEAWKEAKDACREAVREFEAVSWKSADKVEAYLKYGNALVKVADSETGTELFSEAVSVYRTALGKLSQQSGNYLQCAAAQNEMGNALRKLGVRSHDTECLKDAEKAYRAALAMLNREGMPLEWATAQNNLGTALRRLGIWAKKTNNLEEAAKAYQEAEKAYRNALEVFSHIDKPLWLATVKSNLGNVLSNLGEMNDDMDRLSEAVQEQREALPVWERGSLDWARTANNLGSALRRLGEYLLKAGSYESGTASLEEAVTASRSTLEIYKREKRPEDGAEAQDTLGFSLLALGKRETGAVRLKDAREALNAAKDVFEKNGDVQRAAELQDRVKEIDGLVAGRS